MWLIHGKNGRTWPVQYEIIQKFHKKENKYWIKDNFTILNGPYDTVEQAEADVPPLYDLQYPLDFS